MTSHFAFTIRRSGLDGRILIPKYYDPDVAELIESATDRFFTPTLRELLLPGAEGSQLGHWLRREFYDTGTIPYVRTSDLSNWRIRPDFKKGISEEIYEAFAERQDVRPGDLLFVAHGTYLVGDVAMVTERDRKMVLQDHVFKLRTNPATGVSPYLLLAALSTAFVRRQVRIRQFSADIIDKIGDRHLDIRVPIPRDADLQRDIHASVMQVLQEQDNAMDEMVAISNHDQSMFRSRAASKYAFSVQRRELRNRVLVPKYYDPELEEEIEAEEQADGPWPTLSSLEAEGELEVGTGVEVGKMAYGTGTIPFIRTSDLALWEVKRDTKHGISEAIYEQYARKAAVRAGDVLVVRDGTYLVGTSAIIGDEDVPALICGGIFRLRVVPGSSLDPHYLLAALNMPLVRRQMRAKQFTRDVIDTLGRRLGEVRIPPPDSDKAQALAERTRKLMESKAKTTGAITRLIGVLEPSVPRELTGRPGWSMR